MDSTSQLQLKKKHAKIESHKYHAEMKASKEVINKTRGDEAHTFIVKEYLDDYTILLWAQNNNNPTGIPVISRAYVVAVFNGMD